MHGRDRKFAGTVELAAGGRFYGCGVEAFQEKHRARPGLQAKCDVGAHFIGPRAVAVIVTDFLHREHVKTVERAAARQHESEFGVHVAALCRRRVVSRFHQVERCKRL